MSLFRWNYIVPRLVLLFLLLCASEMGAGWALEWALETAGSQAVGARVDIAASKASLLRTRATLRGVEIADPRAPMTNLLVADALDLQFDPAALLRRRAVVDHGVLRGVRLGGERTESGELPDAGPSGKEPSGAGADLPAWGFATATDGVDQWLDGLEDRLTDRVADRFQSPSVAERIGDEWPRRAERLRGSADQLRSSVAALQQQVRDAERNPLRSLDAIGALPRRAADLVQQTTTLRQELEQLREQAAADRRSLAEARRHDEQLLRESLPAGGVDGEAITARLLGDQLAEPINGLLQALRWARRLAASPPPQDAKPAARGVDILFAGAKPLPDVLVRTLRIEGETRIAGRPVGLQGTLTDFATQPRRHDRPMRLRLAATGALPFTADLTLDRTGDTPVDTLLASCPTLRLPAATLGDAEGLALRLNPGDASLEINVEVRGDALAGTVRLVQDRVSLAAAETAGAPSALAERIAPALTGQLADLRGATTTLRLSGALDRPRSELHSTIGPAVAEAFQNAFRDAARAEAEQAFAAARREADARLAAIDAQLQSLTEEVTAKLAADSAWIEKLAGSSSGGGTPRRGVLGVGSRLGLPTR